MKKEIQFAENNNNKKGPGRRIFIRHKREGDKFNRYVLRELEGGSVQAGIKRMIEEDERKKEKEGKRERARERERSREPKKSPTNIICTFREIEKTKRKEKEKKKRTRKKYRKKIT